MTSRQREDHETLNRCRSLIRAAVARFRREEREGKWPVVRLKYGPGKGSVQVHKYGKPKE